MSSVHASPTSKIPTPALPCPPLASAQSGWGNKQKPKSKSQVCAHQSSSKKKNRICQAEGREEVFSGFRNDSNYLGTNAFKMITGGTHHQFSVCSRTASAARICLASHYRRRAEQQNDLGKAAAWAAERWAERERWPEQPCRCLRLCQVPKTRPIPKTTQGPQDGLRGRVGSHRVPAGRVRVFGLL